MKGTASRTAWQLWTLRNLEPGDKVIANKGNSVVLRVGTVVERNVREPYRWDATHHHPHTVSVDWGAPSSRKKIAHQKEWNNNTVAQVSAALYKLITGKQLPKDSVVDGDHQPKASRKELAVLGRLDEKRLVSTRKEQAFLRKHLLGGKDYGECFVCGEKLPVELLVTAHIKARAKCSDKERRDGNNIVPMCLMGCDALFERGRVVVVDNKIEARLNNVARSSRLYGFLAALRARKIEVEVQRKKYFEWHSKHAR
jgi:hypothetical protein